jgi:midasin
MVPKEEEAEKESRVENAIAPPAEASAVAVPDQAENLNAMLDGDPEADATTGGQTGENDESTSLGASGEQQTRSNAQQAEQPSRSFEHSQETNPYRSLGDAKEAWKDRLQVLDPDDDDAAEDPDEPAASKDDAENADTFMHLKDDSSTHDAQVLDTANQEQEQSAEVAPKKDDENPDAADEQAGLDEDEVAKLEQQKHDLQAMEDVVPQPADPQQPTAEDTKEHGESAAEGAPSLEEAASHEGGPDGAGRMGVDERMEPTPVGAGPDGVDAAEAEEAPTAFADPAAPADENAVDYTRLRQDLEDYLAERQAEGAMADADAIEAWRHFSSLTGPQAQDLCEQLRLVLEETKSAKLRGDFRTGKRLNMRKIIPYIASEFRKDKIWMRRTKPSKREYQIMLAIDNSESMAVYHSKQLALESLSVISKALTTLEAGEFSVMSFGDKVELLHPFGQPFTEQSGASVLKSFGFDQSKTHVAQLLESAAAVFLDAKSRGDSSSSAVVNQLLFIVSDSDNLHEEGSIVERRIREANDAGVFVVFVIIDNPEKSRDSILDQLKVVYKDGQFSHVDKYMDRFADKRYIVLRDINMLPHQLGDALRQWFEMVSDKAG